MILGQNHSRRLHLVMSELDGRIQRERSWLRQTNRILSLLLQWTYSYAD
jgi:hypothetical protein